MAMNDPRFLSPWGARLASLGLDVKDVNIGRYIEIDISEPRIDPEEFAEYGEFDTFTFLNQNIIPAGEEVWVYFNKKTPENRYPLHLISRMDIVADRFYLQHPKGFDGSSLKVVIGGDARAHFEPSSKGTFIVEGAVDLSSRPERDVGIVSLKQGTKVDAEITGALDISNRPERQLGIVTVESLQSAETLTRSPVTSSVQITDSRTVLGGLQNRRRMTVYNLGNSNGFIGDSGVGPGDGFPILPGSAAELSFDPNISIPIHAICAAGENTEFRLWEA